MAAPRRAPDLVARSLDRCWAALDPRQRMIGPIGNLVGDDERGGIGPTRTIGPACGAETLVERLVTAILLSAGVLQRAPAPTGGGHMDRGSGIAGVRCRIQEWRQSQGN